VNPFEFGRLIKQALDAYPNIDDEGLDREGIEARIRNARLKANLPAGQYVNGVRVQTPTGQNVPVPQSQQAGVTAAQAQTQRFNSLGASRGGLGRAGMSAAPLPPKPQVPARPTAPARPPAPPKITTLGESPDL
jgi:hypothetical protein